MEPFLLQIYGAAGITSAAAISASAIDRFRIAPAAAFALAGGAMPWINIAMLYHSPNDTALLLGLVSIVPLFLVACLFYSSEEHSTRRNMTCAVTILGLIVGITFCVFIGGPLLLRGL